MIYLLILYLHYEYLYHDDYPKTIRILLTRHCQCHYFIHSYYLPAEENKKIMIASSVYNNVKICSALKMENIYATQFHPEKSGKSGLNIIKNFTK